ncbi:hypothetical protein ABPG77_005362 [Micractinium sp. CCAP 211/92]
MAPRLSPSKRKQPEAPTAAAHWSGARSSQRHLGLQVTKAGSAGHGGKEQQHKDAGLKHTSRGLAGTPAGPDRRETRSMVADSARKTRSATVAAQPAATAAQAASKPPTKAAKPATKPGTKPAKGTATASSKAANRGKVAELHKAAASAASKPAAGRRVHLTEATVDDETFRLGDSVYVVLDTSALQGLSEAEEEDCPCIVCGERDVEERTMLECDRCLAGCHLACLAPPLDEVPEGEWVCPECACGRAPAAPRGGTARERFLSSQGLGLARLDALWQEPDGEVSATLRWYCLPEETHTGRQAHHLAREVFLTQLRDTNSMEAVLRAAHVLPPRDFAAGAACSALGEDVFVCEYGYDSAWQRFRRRTEFDSESEDEGEEWSCGSESESGEEDEDNGAAGLVREALPGGGKRRKGGAGGGRGINRRKQGGEEYLAQVGALAVPEHARQQQRSGGSALSQARSMLTLTVVPRTLPCREGERAQILEFVEEVLQEDGGKCLYVSGIPGTGKTATVLEIMRTLKRRSEAGELPKFQFVEINGLRLPSPQHAYSALYEALTGDRAGPQKAAEALEEMFGGGGRRAGTSRRPTIVLVDEMDLLINKTQTVLYNLFEWPGRKGSRLSIIGIANTMDLPERLHPRIGSRLAGRRIVFQPYSKDQLTTIITSRLEGTSVFKPQALEFIARKVANCSGDVRRCLELCRRAAEIAEERVRRQQRRQDEQQQQAGSGGDGHASSPAGGQPQETGMVELRHVGAAIAEMFNTGHVKMLRESCRLERLLLAAVYLETNSSGRAECVLQDAWERLRVLCSQNCEAQAYDFASVVERAAELGAKRLLICDPGARRVRAKVALNVPTSDLLMVLADDPDLPWLNQAISRAAAAPVPLATGAE